MSKKAKSGKIGWYWVLICHSGGISKIMSSVWMNDKALDFCWWFFFELKAHQILTKITKSQELLNVLTYLFVGSFCSLRHFIRGSLHLGTLACWSLIGASSLQNRNWVSQLVGVQTYSFCTQFNALWIWCFILKLLRFLISFCG